MSLRTIAALAALILLQLGGCATASKPLDPTTNDLERRQIEMMKRLGGSGSGM